MDLMTKSDLKLDHYSWTAIGKDDPRITGKPDSTFLNRHEGYEILSFINRFAKKHNFKQIASGNTIEIILHKHLPSDIRSQANVLKWVEQNFNKLK
ncbi:hypothetical protein C4K04_2061 [Pseudomonas chlororaphis]|jgi:hypothetical protein|uniref:Uncharacterized protein n=1 Tax=Pseudomonas chlororaphis TaxID=587753 RepID=A0A3G7TKV8_9PSED|nr:hypothetical protein [Pseudomonas chlororaphis]AZE47745.1 hypothetical protein C4K04_2061 [Pseudomonas chlororaphis]